VRGDVGDERAGHELDVGDGRPGGGPRIAQTFTAAKTWTASPTVINPLRPFDVDPYKFTYERDFLDVLNLDFNVGEGFVLRVTNPTGNQSVNVRAWSRWARV
jgi:hypothetical protein